jgi:hypothetical protein
MFGGAGRNRIAIEGFCRPLPSHFGYRAFCYSVLADALPHFSAQKDRLRILFHWSLFLLAMELQSHEASWSLTPSSRCRMPVPRATSFLVSSSISRSKFWLSKREIPISAPSRNPTVESNLTSRSLYRRGRRCCNLITPTNSLASWQRY